jgi:hypothetical protein
MGDFIGHTISNMFRVKDAAAFRAWCKRRDLETWHADPGSDGHIYHGIAAPVGQTWPDHDAKTGGVIDFTAELAAHLVDVAILIEAGFEPNRYVGGCAQAIHPDGKAVIIIDLIDIYLKARQTWGLDVSEALY